MNACDKSESRRQQVCDHSTCCSLTSLLSRVRAAKEWHGWTTQLEDYKAKVIWFPWQQCGSLASVVAALEPEFLLLEPVNFFFFCFAFVYSMWNSTSCSRACAAHEKTWQTRDTESINISFHLFICASLFFPASSNKQLDIDSWRVMSLSKHGSMQTSRKIYTQIASLMINHLTCAIRMCMFACARMSFPFSATLVSHET